MLMNLWCDHFYLEVFIPCYSTHKPLLWDIQEFCFDKEMLQKRNIQICVYIASTFYNTFWQQGCRNVKYLRRMTLCNVYVELSFSICIGKKHYVVWVNGIFDVVCMKVWVRRWLNIIHALWIQGTWFATILLRSSRRNFLSPV